MKKELLNRRLKAYSTLAASTLVAPAVNGQVVYTDIVPDFTGGTGLQYFLDLNNDMVDDFRIYGVNSNLYIAPLAYNNRVLGNGGATFAYPYALNFGDPISGTAIGTWFNNGFSSGFQSLNYYGAFGHFGNWKSVIDKYLGLRIDVGGQTYYGWARLDVGFFANTWTVKDYGVSTSPNTMVNAGYVPTDTVSNITAADISDNSDGSDMQVVFDSARNETFISEYQIMVVKSSKATTFTIDSAQAVATGNYTAVIPNGDPTYTTALAAGAFDTDGDPIKIGVNYKIFVVSKNNGAQTNLDNMNVGLDEIMLITPAAKASNVSGVDITDAGDGSDLEVHFTGGLPETGILEYRVLVVKSASAGSFDLAAAEAIAIPDYRNVVPSGGSPYTMVMGASATDTDGDAIANGVSYNIFVLSVADSVDANLSALSNSSSAVILKDYTGVEEQAADAVDMYYNNGRLVIGDLSAFTSDKVALTIYGLNGQQMMQTNISGNQQVDVSSLLQGSYVAVLVSEDHRVTRKFVK